MTTLWELVYVISPLLALGMASLCLSRTLELSCRKWVAAAFGVQIILWSLSVHFLSTFDSKMDGKWYADRVLLEANLGRAAARVAHPEGDEHLIYRIRVWPWRQVVVYNVYGQRVLSSTRAEDFHAALEVVNFRSVEESQMVVAFLSRLELSPGSTIPAESVTETP